MVAWAKSLGDISYPLLSDFWPHGYVAKKYGVLRSEGKSERAIFIIDEDGIIQYIDIHDIDDQPDNEVLFAELDRINPDAKPAEVSFDSDELPDEGVVLYCNKWCPGCRLARNWFENNGIAYQEVDVVTNKHAAYQVRKWADGNLTTPTIYVDGTVIVNWKPKELEKLLLR